MSQRAPVRPACDHRLVTSRRFLALDLETVPDKALVSAVDGQPSRPYAEQLSRLLAERRARSGGRSDFLPLPYHRPVAACALEGIEEDGVLRPADLFTWADRDLGAGEPAFLEEIWRRIGGHTLVTFHGRGFDLPVLELRSLKLGLPATGWFQGRPGGGSADHLDMLDLLTSRGSAPSAPLDLYAKLVGLPGKEGVRGKDVQRLYDAGAVERIVAYCMTDVIQTWLLFLRYRLLEGSLSSEGYAASVRAARQALPALFARRLGPGERAFLAGYLERCAPYFGEDAADPELALASGGARRPGR
jgi:hypothetical protein